MRYQLDETTLRDDRQGSLLEWMLPTGTGGYAMGTAMTTNTRRYHGHLVVARPAPVNRIVLLSAIEAFVTIESESYGLSSNQYVGTIHPEGYKHLKSFQVGNFVEWEWEIRGHRIAKRLITHTGQDAVTISYINRSDSAVSLLLRPLACHKGYHENFRVQDFYPEFIVFPDDRTLITHKGLTLYLDHPGAARTPATGWYYRFERRREAERGLDPIEDLFCPCELRYLLAPGEEITLVASADDNTLPTAFPDAPAPATLADALRRSAVDFLVQVPERTTILAGYPWFADWGRDTMIALPGVCLHTGHVEAAREILRSYAARMHQGLLPNRFVEDGEQPEYNTVDATLWFANAIYKTLVREWDAQFAREALDWLAESMEWHQKGTLYGIKVDPADGLLRQGVPGTQLTWMDAKVGDWVVTPRHGKPIEINGLWINFLRVGEWIAKRLDQDATAFIEAAELAESNFERKFWHPVQGHYLDTADPNDASLRPNQLIAMGLPFSPLSGKNAEAALRKCVDKLLTRHGVRTLGPDEPGYTGRYVGPLAERDAAYHQGTAWPWLLGPLVTAWVRLTGDKDRAREILTDAMVWLSEYGFGGIAEVYDGDEPQFPGGCPWQAWSVAEVLRAWVEDCDGDEVPA